ncbi:MAG: hypothetical protein Hyperionvirus3_160 [Hyperionvirus sp.]|uniref:Uncharacterized protein n=1 Tax=Hyperionvirus sp. TaxID=2487770 RepID=A0A3G5A951_9VIRU|nr:MAG: hypothetical protein Hyperionvirus3_160 [Hyperionvirus sp.]
MIIISLELDPIFFISIPPNTGYRVHISVLPAPVQNEIKKRLANDSRDNLHYILFDWLIDKIEWIDDILSLTIVSTAKAEKSIKEDYGKIRNFTIEKAAIPYVIGLFDAAPDTYLENVNEAATIIDAGEFDDYEYELWPDIKNICLRVAPFSTYIEEKKTIRKKSDYNKIISTSKTAGPRKDSQTRKPTTKKIRKGPSESATQFTPGTKRKGNDGNMWIIKQYDTKNGKIKKWVPIV